MKKFLSALLTCFMLLCLCAGALAAGTPVVDDADLFSDAEEAYLTSLVEAFRSETGMDFGIVTYDQPHAEGTQQRIADDLYDNGGYGLDEEFSGGLYLIDMYERIPYLCTIGALIDYMTDERIAAAHDSNYQSLVRGDYAAAAEEMLLAVQEFVDRGIPEGQYRYDVITGRRLTARHNALTSGEILVSVIIAAAAALIFRASISGSYSLKGSTYNYHFRENSEVTLTAQTDDYLRTTTTRTRKPKQTTSSGGSSFSGHSGGSGVHTSSSGRSHGGGAGRKF